MVTVQAADAAPSSSVQEAAPKSSVRGPPGRRAPLDKAIAHYHSRIPLSTLRRWHENIREFCMQASVSGVIKTGSGCTGCDIFSHVVTHVTEYWRSNFVLPQLGEVQNVLCSEIHEEKQKILNAEFNISLLVPDICQFHDAKVQNVAPHGDGLEFLPHVGVYGAGFCCTDLSKMNRGRKDLKGVVSQRSGKTGTTLDACIIYIVKARPLASFLECVPEMDQDFQDLDGSITNGSDIVEARLESDNFTVLVSCFNCAHYGSAADRVRWWALVIDALPKLYKNIISANFEDTFAALTMDSMDIGEFMLGDEDEFMAWTAEQPLDKKKKGGKAEPDYTVEHEQIFLVHGIKWPPRCDRYRHILDVCNRKPREAELAFLADSLFPETEVGVPRYFDANHSTQRLFNPQHDSDEKTLKMKIRNPWRVRVPTLTCKSCIVMRTKNENGDVVVTQIHPIEKMQLIGWDRSFYKNGKKGMWEYCTGDLLSDFAGNAWSAFAIAPLLISLLVSVPWSSIEGKTHYIYIYIYIYIYTYICSQSLFIYFVAFALCVFGFIAVLINKNLGDRKRERERQLAAVAVVSDGEAEGGLSKGEEDEVLPEDISGSASSESSHEEGVWDEELQSFVYR